MSGATEVSQQPADLVQFTTRIYIQQEPQGNEENNNDSHSNETLNANVGNNSVPEACMDSNVHMPEHNDHPSRHNKPKKAHVAQIVRQDYICDEEDIHILEYIRSLPGDEIVVNIDGQFVSREHMECLFNDDAPVYDDVLTAYIQCMRHEEHLLHRDGGKVFLENTFISSMLHKDGKHKDEPIDYMPRVENYLDNDMVFFPINMKMIHWYLAIVNARQREIHVLDSLGPRMDRADLECTILGLHRQIQLAAQHTQLKQDKWHDLDVKSWPVIEKILDRKQRDGASCGLWMINYMEYWTGSDLSDPLTQEDITNFRPKLAVILWDSRFNTTRGYVIDEDTGNESDVELLESQAKLTEEVQTDLSHCTLGTGISSMNRQELVPTDELSHPQQQHPLLNNDLEAHLGGACGDNDDSLINKQIQQTTPTSLPSQPPSCRTATPVMIPGQAEVNHAAHAASAPMGLQAPSAPQDQDVDMLSRAQTQGRAKKRPRHWATISRGSRSALTQDDINEIILDMGQDMVVQLGNRIREMKEAAERTSVVVWLHFSTSTCKYCRTVICKHCKTPVRSLTQMLDHMNRLHPTLIPTASKRTQQSSCQITEITENPNGQSEQTVETDNSSNTTAAPVDTNAGLLSRTHQHQRAIDLDNTNSWPPSHEQLHPCCEGPSHSRMLANHSGRWGGCCVYSTLWEEGKDYSWTKLITQLSVSSHCLSTTKSTQDPFILKYIPATKYTTVQVQSSPAWAYVRANPYKDYGIRLQTDSYAAGSSFMCWGLLHSTIHESAGTLPGWCQIEWHVMLNVLCSLGFSKDYAGNLVMHIHGKVSNCRYKSVPPHSSGSIGADSGRGNEDEDINNVEQGNSSRNSNRRVRPRQWSKVWDHFTRVSLSEAKCNHCGDVLQAYTKMHGTSQLKRHIRSKHPEYKASLL